MGGPVVLVVGATTVSQQGFATLLRGDGFVVTHPDDAAARSADVALLEVRDRRSLATLCRLHEDERCRPLVAVVAATQLDLAVEAVRCGALSVVFDEECPDRIGAALRGALAGECWMRESVLRRLVPGVPEEPISRQEVDWIGELAAGKTVMDIAKAAGYSERTIYRRLIDAYARLGVRDRHEAAAELRRRALV